MWGAHERWSSITMPRSFCFLPSLSKYYNHAQRRTDRAFQLCTDRGNMCCLLVFFNCVERSGIAVIILNLRDKWPMDVQQVANYIPSRHNQLANKLHFKIGVSGATINNLSTAIACTLWKFWVCLCFVMYYFVSILVSQSSWRGIERWLLCYYGLTYVFLL